jgi:hypothetical protein
MKRTPEEVPKFRTDLGQFLQLPINRVDRSPAAGQATRRLLELPPFSSHCLVCRRREGEVGHAGGQVEKAVERLQKYRTALITAALTGNIDVRTHSEIHTFTS